VLENRQGGRVAVELADERGGGGEIENVVIGKLLAVQLLEEFAELAVKRGGLMRVFAVAQRLRQRGGNDQRLWQADGRLGSGLKPFLQVRRDRRIVGGGAGVNLGGQRAALFQRGVAVALICSATSRNPPGPRSP
jgi:hypothetical protein